MGNSSRSRGTDAEWVVVTARGSGRAGTSPVSLDEVSVLLVDDDATWARTTGRLLERQHEALAVTTATTLADAREAFDALDPDCVVCDYRLESATGLDLLAEVRERAPGRPFVLVTGEGSEAVASEAIGREVTDYVRKADVGDGGGLAGRVVSAVRTDRAERALARERRSKEAMLDIVTETTARDDLAAAFCGHLVTEHGYACAWLGATESGRVVPQAAAGAEGYPDAAVAGGATPGASSEPALVALDRREPHVADPLGADADGAAADTDADDTDADWLTAARDRGFRSAAAVPVAHEGVARGVLSVYATGTGAVDDREVALLREYADAVAHAFRAAEWKRSLLSPAATAAEVEVADGVALVALVSGLGDATVDVRSAVLRDDGRLLYLVRAEGADPDDLRARAEDVAAVESVDVVEADPLRCELLVETPTPESVVVEHGARFAGTRVRHGTATVSFVTPADDDVRTVTDALEASFPDARAVAVRSDESTDPDAVHDARDALTAKQRQALELAFHQGYFERPREHNTTELAEKLSVNRSTFTQHVRASQRKLVSRLLGEKW